LGSAEYVLSVDGGNTKSIALVSKLDGSVVGVGRGGCSDIYTNADPEVPLRELDSAVWSALGMAGAEAPDLVAGAFSLAGADWPEDFAFIRDAMARRGLGKKILVVNDSVGALRAGSASGPAVVVVCGTGAAIAARGADGTVWHNSWWQDPQGGHHLGTRALRAVYRAELGVDPPTSLTGAVLKHFGQETVEDVLHLFTTRAAFHGSEPPRGQVSGLARVLLDAAVKGDETAARIVREHGEALGDYALAAARRVGILDLPFTLVLSGGVLRHASSLLPESLVARVQVTSPGAKPVYTPFEPAVGALFLALEAAGVEVDDRVLSRVTATLPDATLFET
jgi:N-acetylglucosamine kinase-like BadF-type ATPase